MGKNKLKKFADMEAYRCVLQYPWARLQSEGFPYRGTWGSVFFGNANPLVLELGCGKGEYTVELARRHLDKNFIGIDIKGARMWTGARLAETEGLSNVAFLRTDIELIENFFAPEEVGEIWITFPDPQMQKRRKRLTSPRFLALYRNIASDAVRIRLKTDSPFLYAYTSRLVAANGFDTVADLPDLYASEGHEEVKSVKTFYEQQWLSRGKTIKYIDFVLSGGKELVEVDDSDIERDDYHSFQRGVAQSMPECLGKK